jgi:hypothetical protein
MLFLAIFTLLTEQLEIFWREDSLIENLQSLLYLAAALAQLYLSSVFLRRGGERLRGIFHLLLFLLFLVVGMEEISWGQRIFDWETPPFFEEINVQNETNIHNLFSGVFSPLHLAIVLFINTYCYLLPLLFHVSSFSRALLERLRMPVIGVNLISIFIIADLVRPMDVNSLDTQITVLIFSLPLVLYLSGLLSGFFSGLHRPDLQVVCIFIVGFSFVLFNTYGPRIPTLWLWESRELLFAVGFMSHSLSEINGRQGAPISSLLDRWSRRDQ